MSVKLLPANTTTAHLREHTVYTSARLEADPRGEPFRLSYQKLQAGCRVLTLKELDLQNALTIAGAQVEYADLLLDLFVDRVDEATASNDGLRSLLFGRKIPSVFKRPIAGSQLTAMETWPATLKSAAEAEVQALAVEGGAVIEKAHAAVAQRVEANRALREFYAAGDRKAYTARLNAARVEVFSHFDNLSINEPSLGLTRQYARDFFLRTSSEGNPTVEEELASLQSELEGLRLELSLKEERQRELQALKEASDREEALEQERQSKIADLERELASLKQGNRKR